MVTYKCFKGLADPIRYTILDLLSQGPLKVNDLAAHFDVSRPAISRHLRVLRESGLVTESRAGREHTYSLAPPLLEAAAEWLRTIADGVPAAELPAASPPAVPAGRESSWRQW